MEKRMKLSGEKKILFINPPYRRFLDLENACFPLSLGYMATMLKEEGYAVGIYDADYDRRFLGQTGSYEYALLNQGRVGAALEEQSHPVWIEVERTIRSFNPDLVGISGMTNKYPMVERIAAITKQVDENISVVIGGHHPSLYGERLIDNRNIDYVVRGEGERTMVELAGRCFLSRPDLSKVRGLIYKENGQVRVNPPRELIPNIDSLPIPDRALMINDHYFSGNNIMTSRGCPFHCSYCGARVIWERKIRCRSVEKVMEEVHGLIRKTGQCSLSFWDDSFTLDREYMKKLMTHLESIEGVSFSCITRLDLVDSEVLSWLKRAGCNNILFGIESGSDYILKSIRKGMNREMIKRKVAEVHSSGIPWLGFFIMGYPGETKEDILGTLSFMKELNPPAAEINIFNPLPGTPIWEELEEKGKVNQGMDLSSYSQSSLKNRFTPDLSQQEFEELALYVAKAFDRHNLERSKYSAAFHQKNERSKVKCGQEEESPSPPETNQPVTTQGFPKQVHFLMIDKCNAKCIMCGGNYFHSKSGRMITLESFKRMARNLRLEQFRSLVLSGAGDPLLNPWLVPVIEYINSSYPQVSVSITTNGIALSQNLFQDLLNCKIDSINVSINAARRITYHRIMQVDCFERVCDQTKKLVTARKEISPNTKIQFSAAINRLNIYELPHLIEIGHKLGIDSVNIMYTRFYPERIRNLSVEKKEDRLLDQDSLYYHQELSDYCVETAKLLARRYGMAFSHEPLFKEKTESSVCRWPFSEVMVGFNGEVYPCGGAEVHFKEKIEMGVYNFGNALKSTIYDFWNNQYYQAIRKSCQIDGLGPIPECENCANRMNPHDVRSHIFKWEYTESPIPQPLVSVIVPTYNRPDTLMETLRSIFQQTYQHLEILVVNDAGADIEDVISFMNEDRRITYVKHDRNRGLAAARNTGLKLAKGKYIAYLDDDDLFSPHHLETLVNHLESSKFRVAYTDAYRAHQTKKDGKYVILKRDVPYSFDFDENRLLKENYIPVLCILHEKSCLEDVGCFDETLRSHEDWDLWIRLSRKFKFIHLKEITCEFSWRDDNTNLTYLNRKDMDATRKIVSDRGKKYISEQPPEFVEANRSQSLIKINTFTLGKLELMNPDRKEEQISSLIEYCVQNVSDVAALNDLGVMWFLQADIDKGKVILEQALRLDPYNMVIMKNLFYIYIKVNCIQAAFQMGKNILAQLPEDIEYLFLLADLCVQCGKKEDALIFWNRILQIDPTQIRAQNKLEDSINFNLKEDIRTTAFQNTFDSNGNNFPAAKKPQNHSLTVSIIIPVYNKIDFTRKCLDKLYKHGNTSYIFEVIIINDGSTDETQDYLRGAAFQFSNLKVFELTNNLGFTLASNQGAQVARGEFVLFLNNDTEPQSDWLEALVDVMKTDASIGIAGSKLVYPDGRLQEAGGIIFSDGSGWNYGRFDDPDHPRYNYVREVDYVSGASLLIRRSLLKELHYFDEQYSPGYYEDTDLCFQVRSAGYKVIYCPFSRVVHHEGISSGTDLSKGMKKYQLINQKKFVQKWAPILKDQFPPDPKNVVLASERDVRGNILIVDPLLPMFDRASGSQRLFQIIKLLRKKGHHVTFIARNGLGQDSYGRLLEKMGVEVYATDPKMMRLLGYPIEGREVNLEALLRARHYHYAVLCFYDIAIQYLPPIRAYSPDTTIFIDTVDIHFVREARVAALENDKNLEQKALATQKAELAIYREADAIVTVTENDWEAVKHYLPGMPHVVIPNIHLVSNSAKPAMKERRDILFVGGFPHLPNVDAMLYFCSEIWPQIINSIPEVKLFIVGNQPPEQIKRLAADNIIVTGYVPDISAYLNVCRISVAPLRYGAGMKGKVGEALAAGVPVVGTNIAAEGMELVSGKHIIIADSPEDFAEAVVHLYKNEPLWTALSQEGQSFIREHYSPKKVQEGLENMFSDFGASLRTNKLINSKRNKTAHRPVSIVIPVFNGIEFTKECLQALIENTPGELYEVIIVNNGSTDGTGEFLRCLEGDIKIIANEINLGFSKACNQGAAVAQGELILFLNNDTVSSPGWLEALIEKAREDETVGVLGSKLLYPDGSIQHAGVVVGTRDNELSPYHIYICKPADDPAVNKCREFQMVTGACLLVRTEIFRRLGGFDEEYVNGHEDLDLCLRVRQAGFKVIYCPESVLTHYESRTKRLIGLDNFHYQRGVDNEEGKGRKRFLEKWSSTLERDDQKIFLEDGMLLERSLPPQEQVTRVIEAKPLRILFTMYGWNESGGGTTFPKAVTKELASRGHHLSVFYASLKIDPSQPPYSMDRKVEDSVTLYGVYNRPAVFIDPDHPEREIRDDGILACFRKVLDEVMPDIVHFNNFHGLTFALAEEVNKKGIPSCYTPHNYHVIDPNLYLFTSDLTLWKDTDIIGNSEALKRNPEKLTDYLKRGETTRTLLNQWVDLTLAVSTRQKDLLVQFGATPEKIAVVHQANPSTDLLWNDSEIAKEATRAVKRPLRFGFIGGVTPHKGVHMLVAAAQAFDPREAEFHIFGFVTSGYAEQLQKIDAKKIVRFHGEYNQEDLGKMAHFLDIAIVPSVWEDCAPLVLLELMAMRLPIIGAQIGGIPDFVQEGINGFLYPYNSVEALVERIKSCLTHPEKVSEMRRRLLSPHSFRAYVDHIEAIYHDLRARQKVNDRNSLLINLGRERTPAIVWEGAQYVNHSLALINREFCLKLIDEGFELSILTYEQNEFGPEADPRFPKLASRFNRALPGWVDIHIRHQWPPNLNPPPEGRWIMIQPWEFGSLPKKWIEIMKEQVDELWVPSNFVRETFIQSGISPGRVQVIPNGINPKLFNPRIPPRNLGTIKRFKFLFVGGTIWRKGIDLLLEAYSETFSNKDDVSLVIKDMGGNSFYQGQTSCERIKKIQSKPASPEIMYFTEDLPPTQMGTLYNACNCLVHPYRGEGFGLPIAEAMACGLPVIVTGAGACLDFCNPTVAYLLPAQKRVFPQKRIDDMETIDFPFIYEPDKKVLADTMRRIYENPVESKNIGTQARRHIVSNFTWSRGAKIIKERIKEVSNRPILRFQKINRDQLLIKGESLFNQGDLDGAKEVFKVLLKLNKTDLEGLNNLGVIAFQQGDIEQAIKYFVEILDMEPTHYGSLENLSQIFLNQDNPQAAIECFQKALDHNPKNTQLLNGLGYCFVKKQDFEKAQEVYERSIVLDPNQANIQELLQQFTKLNNLYTTAA
jgi:GT2 family glycosyltransferase/glycosyltransferase involved in cell wall biosynthesis/radical SAM superfamily enzyme YgiQ (UPF0313 family)/MoaA/NifB/PqqE/SkfB family radical SAM enzyme/cytochrome c-type biogenesis protein CcmH/NrfG